VVLLPLIGMIKVMQCVEYEYVIFSQQFLPQKDNS